MTSYQAAYQAGPTVGETAALHGGNLAEVRRLFPQAPEPLIDLSTGINPHPYRMPDLPPATFTRLPEPESIARLEALAAERYGAPAAGIVVATSLAS